MISSDDVRALTQKADETLSVIQARKKGWPLFIGADCVLTDVEIEDDELAAKIIDRLAVQLTGLIDQLRASGVVYVPIADDDESADHETETAELEAA